MPILKTRACILVLVILAALPALVLTVYSAIERRGSEERQARAELSRLVRLAAMQQWQVVESARQMMVASGQILLTLLQDKQRCTKYFASLLAQNRDSYHSMGLFTKADILPAFVDIRIGNPALLGKRTQRAHDCCRSTCLRT